MGDRVVLLHGLGRSPRSMRRLASGLEEAGFAPLAIGYPSRTHSIAELIEQLRPRLAALGPGTIHFVGHSLANRFVSQSLLGFFKAALAQPCRYPGFERC